MLVCLSVCAFVLSVLCLFSGHIHVLAFLKSVRSTKDDSGVSAQDIVARDPQSDLARLLTEKERGELW